MELGLYTFADVSRDPHTRQALSPEVRLRNLIEEIELADQVGLDVFGVGEHHRPDYSVSAPGALLVGSPQEVADKIVREHAIFGNQRFLLQQTSLGALPHADVLRAIELVGTQVAPQVRAATAESRPVNAPV